MLLLYVFIILLILLTLLSAFGGSIRAAPSPSPLVKFEKFSAEEQNEIEEFMASEPFRRGLNPPTMAPLMANVVSPGTYQQADYLPTYNQSYSAPATSMMMATPQSQFYEPQQQQYEMYQEKIDDGMIEPFEQNELQQAAY